MPRVFVVNKSSHDFSPAAEFGELVYLSEGPMNRYEANNMARQFLPHLLCSSKEDYLLPCGLSIMNMIAASVFAHLHGRLNLLLYKNKVYKEINLVFDEVKKGD
jgi:hypothetical protein